MKLFKPLALTLLLLPTPVLACSFDTDCSIGARCAKSAWSITGVCIGGLAPGNSNDRRPAYAPLDLNGTYGNTCAFSTDCGPGSICVKQGGITGVCLRR